MGGAAGGAGGGGGGGAIRVFSCRLDLLVGLFSSLGAQARMVLLRSARKHIPGPGESTWPLVQVAQLLQSGCIPKAFAAQGDSGQLRYI